jgi:hypothetical protein
MTLFTPNNQTVPDASAKMQTPHVSNSRHKLHHQIARHFHEARKIHATIFKSRCKRTVMCCPLYGWKPYPLSRQGFYGSPIARRKLRGVPRDGRAMGAKHPARNPAKYLASYPRNVPAMAGQWQRQCRRTSVKTTRKTTCLAPDLARHVRAGNLRDDSQIRANLNHDIPKIMNTPTTPTPDLESLRKAVQGIPA